MENKISFTQVFLNSTPKIRYNNIPHDIKKNVNKKYLKNVFWSTLGFMLLYDLTERYADKMKRRFFFGGVWFVFQIFFNIYYGQVELRNTLIDNSYNIEDFYEKFENNDLL